MQMRVSNNSAGHVRAGLGLDAFVRLEPVAVRGGRRRRELVGRFTFAEIRCDPTQELGSDRYVVTIRRSSHPCAVTKPPETGETNEVVSDDKVSDVADAGCMSHVHEIDTPTLDPELTQS